MQLKTKLTFLLLTLFVYLSAQTVKSPNDFLPHNLGEHFTPHYMVVDYFQHVAQASEKVQMIKYGETNQKRPLHMVFVSTKENLANLEEIRKNNLRRTGLAKGEVDESNPIAIVWLSFGVHGNEAGASESSMQAIYEFVTRPEAAEWLKNTVIIMDPSVNPDGYSRYTHWNRNMSSQHVHGNPAHIAREHHEPWPGGRVNHYLFDLNRDWAWATQTETRHRLIEYQKWMPHIHADFHEQFHNAPYYFAPAAQPYHTYITDWQNDFQYDIGRNHAKHFDREGWLYFTREVFDLFYPSYGDTYPTFNGAIGMTYEQGGHSFSGRAIVMENGDTLTLYDRVAHHKTTALSTVEVASKNAAKMTQKFAEYFKKNVENPPGEYKTFIIKGSNSQQKIKALTAILDQHGIKYGSTESGGSVSAFDYTTGKNTRYEIQANDLIISAYQPKGLLAQVLFDPRSELVDSLTYDITAWSLIYAHGLDAYAASTRVNPTKAYKFKEYQNSLKNQKPYAYLATWESMQNARFLSSLLQNGVQVRFAEDGFLLEGKKYPAGTLVITRADNRKNADFHTTVRATAEKYQQEIFTAKTGFVTTGPDFGSDRMTLIKTPRIAVLSGERTFPNEYGQVWYYFEQDLGYPVTMIDSEKLGQTKLHDYNVLVLPEGYYKLNDDLTSKLNRWVAGGGRLIAIGAANSSLQDKDGFALTKYAKDSDKSAAQKLAQEAALNNRTALYKDHARSAIPNSIPGAIYKIKMDNSHPLGFGLDNHYFSLKTSGTNYDLLKGAWNVGYIGQKPMLSGFVGSEMQKKLENSAVFAVQDKGRGAITYLIDNPLYRGFWEEGKFLFSNAVFFAGQ